MTTELLERHGTGFLHEALFYSHPEELLHRLVEFIQEGISAGEPALVVMPADRLSLLREHLPDADGVEYQDMQEVGRNPARLISVWSDFVHTHGSGDKPMRGVGEPVWPDRSPEELEECRIHEGLLDFAFDDTIPWTLVCPYDASALPSAVVEQARTTHAAEHPPSSGPNGADPLQLLDGPLPPVPPWATPFPFEAHELRDLRRLVKRESILGGLGDRAEDFVFAVHELAANSLAHGGGRGELRLWKTEHSVIGQVLDRGRIRDPLAGRRRPPPHRVGGYGLWLANQLCDLVQVRTNQAGTLVRLHMHSA